MAHRLVDLERELRSLEDDVEHAGGTHRSREEGHRLLGDPRCVAEEVEPGDELVTGAREVPAERAGVGAALELPCPGRVGLDPRSAAGEGLADEAARGVPEELLHPPGGNGPLGHRHPGDGEDPLSTSEQEFELLAEGDGERVPLARTGERGAVGRLGRKRDALPLYSCRGTGDGEGGLRRAGDRVLARIPGRGEPPCPVVEDADPDPARLAAGEGVHLMVPRVHVLLSAVLSAHLSVVHAKRLQCVQAFFNDSLHRIPPFQLAQAASTATTSGTSSFSIRSIVFWSVIIAIGHP